ncbi:subunit beta of pyruvate dehydrogenase [Hamiltosporidium tvaerminnensis]|uniref:Pyruvate dehydrogenase E1 component subunit beta n=1 Tax=Hamiltosporidium tvaerminnensis TaxID=1176355 RepID=A0A4Q9L8Z7_9MICR|nr:subunit beta of pyruvate dehydrogenase [Hamiltosporidium tvaerminnensis]
MEIKEKKKISIRDALNIALDEEMDRDERVYVIGEEVGIMGGAYKVTRDLQVKYGCHRVLDAPISEMGFTGLAIGSCWGGLRPVVDFMTMNFALQAIDQIINSAAKTLYMSGGRIKSPIVFRGPNGFAYGVGAQHTQDFCNYYGSVPGLKVVAPYTAKDHRGLLKSAIRDENPVVFLENEILYNYDFDRCESFENPEYLQPLDKAVIEIQGSDITLIGISISMLICQEASQILKEEGISCELINLISIRPIDIETLIKSVTKTRYLCVVDYTWPSFSTASEISAQINEKCFHVLKSPVLRINGEDIPTPYAENLEKMSFPTVEKSGLNAEESWERASMGVIMRSEMHEEPIPPLKEAKREEDGVKILKPKNNTPLISQGGTTLEEPTNNINEESDLEEEKIVVKEVEENI